MAWTTPKTWVANEGLTAALFNTHIRDNLLALKSPPRGVKNINEATDYTTTSTSWAYIDTTDVSITITTTGGDVTVFWLCNVKGSTSITVYFDLWIDGTPMGGDSGLVAQDINAGTAGEAIPLIFRTNGLAAGSHQFRIVWRVSSGTATILAGAGTSGADLHPQFSVVETG